MNIQTRHTRTSGEGYLRWKKQLEALKRRDVHTVRRLAGEARIAYSAKYGPAQLRLS